MPQGGSVFSYLLHGRAFCDCLPVLKSVWLEKDPRILTSALSPNQESALEKCESISCPESLSHSANLGEEQMVGGSGRTMLLFSFVNPPNIPTSQSSAVVIPAKYRSALADFAGSPSSSSMLLE